MDGLECMCDPEQDNYQTAYDFDEVDQYATAEFEEPPRRRCQCASRRSPPQNLGGQEGNVIECPAMTPKARPCRCAPRDDVEGAGNPCRCGPGEEAATPIPQRVLAKYGNLPQRRTPKVRPRGQAAQVNIPASIASKYFPKGETPSKGKQVEFYRAHEQGEYCLPCPAGRGSPADTSMSSSFAYGRPRATSSPIHGGNTPLPADRSFSPSRFQASPPSSKCQGCCQRGCCQ